MIDIKNKEDCCGCNACFSICPKECIYMVEDETEGFKYPKIDKEKCINCNLCNKVCPMIKELKVENNSKFYACRNLNDEIRMKSSSGGVFSLIAEYVIKNNGIVYGVVFDKDFNVIHKGINSLKELKAFRGSKYVQSDIGNTYKEAKNKLDLGTLVLFSGTQCQIKGLNLYLGKKYDNLITIEVICHGVPSPKVFKNYIDSQRLKYNSEVEQVKFRDKTFGWKKFCYVMNFKNKRQLKEDLGTNIYMKGFLKDLYLRESCYNCKSKNNSSGADISLADYWGVQFLHPEIDDDKGISLMIINTNIGERIIKRISDKLLIFETNKDHAIKYNKCILKSVSRNPKRDKFFENIDRIDIVKNIKKNTKSELKIRIKNVIKRMVY